MQLVKVDARKMPGNDKDPEKSPRIIACCVSVACVELRLRSITKAAADRVGYIKQDRNRTCRVYGDKASTSLSNQSDEECRRVDKDIAWWKMDFLELWFFCEASIRGGL